jgi:hypothetical protein
MGQVPKHGERFNNIKWCSKILKVMSFLKKNALEIIALSISSFALCLGLTNYWNQKAMADLEVPSKIDDVRTHFFREPLSSARIEKVSPQKLKKDYFFDDNIQHYFPYSCINYGKINAYTGSAKVLSATLGKGVEHFLLDENRCVAWAALSILGQVGVARNAEFAVFDGFKFDGSKNEDKGLDLAEWTLNGASFRKADLRYFEMYKVQLQDADLTGANLKDAVLRRANLYEADLVDVNLKGVNLENADLRGADLKGVKNWREVKSFHGLDLSGVKNLSISDILYAINRDVIKYNIE